MRRLSSMSLFAILMATGLPAAQPQEPRGQPRTADEVSPFVGTWKQNIDKSFNSDPYSAVIRIESAGLNRVRIIQEVARTAADAAGKIEPSVGEFTLDGTEGHPSGMAPDETQSFRQINPHVWERIARRPGDIRRGFWAVSNDGKMLVITGYAKTETREYYAQRVLEKQ